MGIRVVLKGRGGSTMCRHELVHVRDSKITDEYVGVKSSKIFHTKEQID